jgi:hypothetical protein
MDFDVSDFTANISKKGLASANKFEVRVFIPLTNGNTTTEPLSAGVVHRHEELELMCDTATIAGKTIQTSAEIQYGLRREVAYGAPTFDALALTFYCSEELEEKKILDRWQNKVVKTGGDNPSFNIGYYDDYAKFSKIEVRKLSMSGEVVFKYQYLEVYPKTITSIDLSHGTSSGPVKISATFNYTHWKDITQS